jgi:DNA-binding NarL/FixJ family response regulator/predicted regulator of Ras-like GTPase activity (Roadblock/LC7/MglB family)
VAGREGTASALHTQVELWGNVVDWTVATSANEALWEVRGSPYDLVLAPWQLPEMTGIEFAEVVLALSPATKVVLVGVPVTPALHNQAQALGVFGLLSDADPERVAALISRALEIPIPETALAAPQAEEKRPAAAPPKAMPKPPLSSPQVSVPPRAREALRPIPSRPAAQAGAEPLRPPTLGMEPRAVSWTPEQQERVRSALQALLTSVGPLLGLLVDAQGQVLLQEGSVRFPKATELAAHAVRILGVREEAARLLGDEHLLGVLFLTGARYDLYAFGVTETIVLLLVFDRAVAEGKLGPVWIYARRAVEELRSILSP